MKRTTVFILIFASLFSFCSCKHKHSFGEWIVTENPTCYADGSKVRICDCQEFQSESIPALAHSPTVIGEIAPSCNTYGYTAGTKCEICEIYIDTPIPISPSHSYSTVSPGPTCTEPKACLVCAEVAESALGHTVEVGICDRCNEYIPPKVILPIAPIKTTLAITGCTTEFELSSIDYKIIGKSLVITYSGTKIKDEGDFSNGRYVCGFSYSLIDANGATVTTENASITNLAVGDIVVNQNLVIDLPENPSAYYLLDIGNYNVK